MRRIIVLSVLLLVAATPLIAGQGMVNVKSMHNVPETADRLESVLQSKGMTVIARINHSMAAQNAGMTLRPTELLIFGNPKVGTPLMQCQQSIALDLPQKALIWEDESGSVPLILHIAYRLSRAATGAWDAMEGRSSQGLGSALAGSTVKAVLLAAPMVVGTGT